MLTLLKLRIMQENSLRTTILQHQLLIKIMVNRNLTLFMLKESLNRDLIDLITLQLRVLARYIKWDPGLVAQQALILS